MITLKTLPQATEQQVFNQVATHLLTQNAKSVEKNHNTDDPDRTYCVYKGPNNLACAAGCLIANDEYNAEFEENSWSTLTQDYNVPDTHQILISRLQVLHDQTDVQQWPQQLCEIAKLHNLNTDVVDNFNK